MLLPCDCDINKHIVILKADIYIHVFEKLYCINVQTYTQEQSNPVAVHGYVLVSYSAFSTNMYDLCTVKIQIYDTR